MTHTKRTVRLLLLGLLAAPLGCSSGGNVNIGDTQNLGSKLSDYAAHWDGYAEAYVFTPSNADNIHLVLDAQGNGTVQVGTDPLLPAPTDPTVGYPPGYEGLDKQQDVTPTDLQGGVLYPVHAAQVQTGRIQLGLKPHDYYAAWCALQTPHYIIDGYMGTGIRPGDDGGTWTPIFAYSILPGSGGSESTDSSGNNACFAQITAADGSTSSQQIDCGLWYLGNSGVCTCTATACTSSPSLADGTAPVDYPVEIDAALDTSGKNMTGTLIMNGTRVTVHLQRQ